MRNFYAGANRLSKMKTVVDKCMAWIGKTPVWYLQTTGRPMGNDWWMFQYAVGLQAKAYSDWYFNYADENNADYYDNGQYSQDVWRMVYPAKMSPFVHILSGQPDFNIGPTTGRLANANQAADGKGVKGSVWGNYMPTRPYNWNNGFPYSTSAECDISLWSGLQLLSADIVPNDPSFGLVGYGAEVSDGGDSYEVTPQDGLYRRLNIVGDRFQMELMNDRYTAASIAKNYKDVQIELENATGTAHTGTVTLRNLAAGEYNVRVSDELQDTVTVAAGATQSFEYEIGAGDAELRIVEAGEDDTVDEDHVISVAITPQNAYALKGGTTSFDATVNMVNEGGALTGDVEWSVTGGESDSTSIDASGDLHVAADETAQELTVKAASADDPTKFGTAKAMPYKIIEVTITTPADTSVQKGKSVQLFAAVEHENAPASLNGVEWSITGGDATDSDTAINASGVLSVGSDETAQSLTIRAASKGDASKYAELSVAIESRVGVKRDNALLYYIFDGSEETGGALKDYSKNGYDATISGTVNSASWTGDGFAFNGTNYIDLPNEARLINPEMTVVFRIKRTGNMGAGSIIWAKNSSDYAGNGMWINTSNGLFVSHDGFSANFEFGGTVDALFPLNEWVEIGYAIDTTESPSKGILTVNGQTVSTAIPSEAKITPATSPQNSIGAAGYDFNEKLNYATMGKFLIFDRALTEAELLKVYGGNFPSLEPADQALVDVLSDMLDAYKGMYEDVKDSAKAGSLAAFKTAIDAAQAIVDTPADYTDEDVIAAVEKLAETYDALEFKADKSGLRTALDSAKEIDADKLITSARAALLAAIEEAESVYEDDDATQQEIDEAYLALVEAMVETGQVKGENWAKLEALEKLVKTVQEASYTPSSFAAFETALDKAQDMIADKAAYTQTKVDAAYDALYAAWRGLARVANFAALQSAVGVAQDIVDNIDDYVAASVEGLADALDSAKTVLANKNSTQAQVDAAASFLTAEIVQARIKEDKSRLAAAYRSAATINESLYTQGSVAVLHAAMSAADKVLKAPEGEYTQAQVDTATAGVNMAVKGLVLVSEDSGKAGVDADTGADNGGGNADDGKGTASGGEKAVGKAQGAVTDALAPDTGKSAPASGNAAGAGSATANPPAASGAQTVASSDVPAPVTGGNAPGSPNPSLAQGADGTIVVADGSGTIADIAIPASEGDNSGKTPISAYVLLVLLIAAAVSLALFRYRIARKRQAQQQ
jgi:hypothetical protein